MKNDIWQPTIIVHSTNTLVQFQVCSALIHSFVHLFILQTLLPTVCQALCFPT